MFFQQYAHYNSDLTDMKMTRLLYNPDNRWFNRDPSQGLYLSQIGPAFLMLEIPVTGQSFHGGQQHGKHMFRYRVTISS